MDTIRSRSLLLATNNLGKQIELRRMLSLLPIALVVPSDIGLALEVDETADTIQGNALLKAREFYAASGMPSLADDSGLCVDALDGAPGVHSARFGGLSHSPKEQNLLLIELLHDVPMKDRGAEFISVIAFSRGNHEEWVAEGRTRGQIAEVVAASSRGFGYDPVFFVPERGKTYSQMTGAEKDAVSHRGKALALAIGHLKKSFGLLE